MRNAANAAARARHRGSPVTHELMPGPVGSFGTMGATIWLTGLPGSGKSTTSSGLHRVLSARGIASLVIDGDVLRRGVNAGLGFTKQDRSESVRRAGEIALLAATQGFVAIVSLVSPYAEARAGVRHRHNQANVAFVEVWLSAPIEVCEQRGPRQLYARARRGELAGMTGVNDPYEGPVAPEIVLPTHQIDATTAIGRLVGVVDDLLAVQREGGGSTTRR